MKHLLVIVSLVSIVSFPVFGQDDTSFVMVPELSVSGGISYPSVPQELRDYWKKGFNVGGGFGYSFREGSLGQSGIHGFIQYNGLPFDQNGYLDGNKLNRNTYQASATSRKIITAMANYRGTFSQLSTAIAPYFLMGIGYFHLSSNAITVISANDTSRVNHAAQSAFSWLLGIGMDIPARSKFSFFLEGRFVLGVTGEAGTQFYPLSSGIRFRP